MNTKAKICARQQGKNVHDFAFFKGMSVKTIVMIALILFKVPSNVKLTHSGMKKVK